MTSNYAWAIIDYIAGKRDLPETSFTPAQAFAVALLDLKEKIGLNNEITKTGNNGQTGKSYSAACSGSAEAGQINQAATIPSPS
jgi:hypothetical protein